LDHPAAKISRQEPLCLSITEGDFFVKKPKNSPKLHFLSPIPTHQFTQNAFQMPLIPPDKVSRQIA
jgi:hypothetical protein